MLLNQEYYQEVSSDQNKRHRETIDKAVNESKQKNILIFCLERLSEFSDSLPNFLAQKRPSYIPDTTIFVNKIKHCNFASEKKEMF